MKIEPVDVYLVWVDRQELPDIAVASFAQVEALLTACHQGRDHPDQPRGEHKHHSDHAFEWAPPPAYAAEINMAPTPGMLSWHCHKHVTVADLEDIASAQGDEAADEADFASCPCRFERPLISVANSYRP